MKQLFLFLPCLLLLVCSSACYAASFDCNKAQTAIEKLICGDNELSKLDDKLDNVYKSALKELKADKYSKRHLPEEQKSWLKYTRTLCDNSICLKKIYEQRIKELLKPNHYDYLEEEIKIDGEDNYVHTLLNPNYRIHSFNEDLAKRTNGVPFYEDKGPPKQKQGKIVGCDLLIEIPRGTMNHLYGGFCTLINGSEKTDVQICNDEMIGGFTMEKIKKSTSSKQDLIKFTLSNCHGGGG
jgi:uncharacterized protein